MPFAEVSKVQERQKLIYRIEVCGVTVSEAAREAGVSRKTAYKWLRRAAAAGIAGLEERTRRPQRCPSKAPVFVQDLVLAEKAKYPEWGAKKIVHSIWGREAPVCVRTVDRILKRHGLVRPRNEIPEMQRFERSVCNELWQIDFKGLVKREYRYLPLSIIDDCSRFCLGVIPVERPHSKDVFDALWRIFGDYGLPECILSDNGDCFNSTRSNGAPTPFQANLWLLGIQTTHGRPAHPQTQGKVERFHRTMQDRMNHDPLPQNLESARKWLKEFTKFYNWDRPHEAIDFGVPGAIYSPSPRPRPAKMPVHHPSGKGLWKKVHYPGVISYKGKTPFICKGLIGQHIEMIEEEGGFGLHYAGRRFGRFNPDDV